jgi:hypothetical protein
MIRHERSGNASRQMHRFMAELMAATSLGLNLPSTCIRLRSSDPEKNQNAPVSNIKTAQIENRKVRILRGRFMRSNAQRSRR